MMRRLRWRSACGVSSQVGTVRVWRVVTGCCCLTARCSCGCSGAGIRQCGATGITGISLPTQLSVVVVGPVIKGIRHGEYVILCIGA